MVRVELDHHRYKIWRSHIKIGLDYGRTCQNLKIYVAVWREFRYVPGHFGDRSESGWIDFLVVGKKIGCCVEQKKRYILSTDQSHHHIPESMGYNLSREVQEYDSRYEIHSFPCGAILRGGEGAQKKDIHLIYSIIFISFIYLTLFIIGRLSFCMIG